MSKWLVVNKKADFKGIGEKFHIDQVTARVIRNREIIEEADIRQYLEGGMKDLHNPHLLKDVDKLTDILMEKIQKRKPIRIIGDYDIDGVMATYILMTALKRCHAIVTTQIPDRIHDGYGLNKQLIEKAYADGVDTIVTCDNGISAIEEIAFAKEKGMTVLVTDHHAIPYEDVERYEQDTVVNYTTYNEKCFDIQDVTASIYEQVANRDKSCSYKERVYKYSNADAIVNPHQKECTYPYKELCGAAVAWKVVCVLYEKFGVHFSEAEVLLENVAFATIGDVMPLTKENRILVKEGLKRIQCTKNLGMKALIAQCQLENSKITAGHIGFRLGPCINASGRLDTAKRALELFFHTNKEDAIRTANELVELNNERKNLTEEGVDLAIEYYKKHKCDADRVLVIYLPEVHESIAGIIAGRIREKYYKPVFILTNAEDGGLKGSGRSIVEYSMYEEMCKCQELFTKFGGHPMAAGLSLPKENLEIFRRKINAVCTLTEDDLTEKVRIDVPMPMDYVSLGLVEELSRLEPFGKDNERPIFADKGIRIRKLWIVGQNQNVLRLDMITAIGTSVSGIYFGDIEDFKQYIENKFGKEALTDAFLGRSNPIVLAVIYDPDINSYRGVDSLQFIVRQYQ